MSSANIDEKLNLATEQEAEEKKTISVNTDKKIILTRLTIPALIIVISLLIIVFGPKSSSKPQNPLIATIQDQPVYLSDVKNVALEQYQQDAINNDVLHLAYETLVERIILNKEAQKLAIVVTDKEISDKLKSYGVQIGEAPRAFKMAAKYDILKEKLIKTVVKSTEAYSIGFYIASYEEQKTLNFTPQEQMLFNRQRVEGKKALSQIEADLRHGETPLTIANTIFKTYPSLQPILALNGYIFQSAPKYALENPKLYTYDDTIIQQPFFNTLYTMQPGEIKVVEDQGGAGGNVIQVKSVNQMGVKDYETWLDAKKKELVKTNNYNI